MRLYLIYRNSFLTFICRRHISFVFLPFTNWQENQYSCYFLYKYEFLWYSYYTIKRMALYITLVIYSIFPFFIIIIYLLYLSKFHITACAFSKSILATKISYWMACDVGFHTLPKFPRSVPDPAHSPKWLYVLY